MEKNEGSPERSPSEQERRREMPPPPPPLPSSEGSESENVPAGGEGNLAPVRGSQEMVIVPVPMESPPTPRPSPTRFRVVPGRDSSFRVVVREPLPGNTRSNNVRLPPGGPGMNRDGQFAPRGVSRSWSITLPQNGRRGQIRELPIRQPRCVTCGKTFGSWKALFGHLRSHPDREYRGAFPPPKASNVDPLITNLRTGFKGLDIHQQRELTLSLINAATVVSAMLDPVGGAPENAMEIGEGSGAGRASGGPSGATVVDLNNPDENRRSLRNDGLELDLNEPPPPESDSEDEDPK